MPRDWEIRYGCRPLLLETLVDAARFRGPRYRAANWIHVGQTTGLRTGRRLAAEFRDLIRQTSQKVAPAKTSTTRAVASADSGSARGEEGFWVVVLPFRYAGASAELKALANGLSEEIDYIKNLQASEGLVHNSHLSVMGVTQELSSAG